MMEFRFFKRPTLDLSTTHIVADGNSQTSGGGGVTAFPSFLATLLGVTVTNFGVSGQTTQQMIDDAASQIDSTIDPAKVNILICAEIRNELVTQCAALNVDTAVDRFWSYVDARRTAGWDKIIVWDVLPNTTTSCGAYNAAAMNAFFDQANTRLLAEWSSHADVYVQMRSNVNLATASASNAYWADGIHPTTLSHQTIMAPLLETAIRNL